MSAVIFRGVEFHSLELRVVYITKPYIVSKGYRTRFTRRTLNLQDFPFIEHEKAPLIKSVTIVTNFMH